MKIGIPFFLWVGCYSLTILAQFWAFANDIYTPEQGKRVFAVIGVGSSLGALIGSYLAKLAFKPLGPLQHDARPGRRAACSASSIVRIVDARETQDAARKKEAETPPGGQGGMSMIFSQRYLLLIAAIIFMVNLINTNGEYILDRTLDAETARRGLDEAAAKRLRRRVHGDYYFYANLARRAAPALRHVARLQVPRRARRALPLSAPRAGELHGDDVPALARVRQVGKITENASITRSTTRPSRRSGCPTSREQKYVAKQAIDTFVVRAGDFVAGMLVAAGAFLVPRLAGGHIDDPRWTKIYTITNVILAALFLGIVILMGREHKKRAAEAEAKKSPATEAKEESASAA